MRDFGEVHPLVYDVTVCPSCFYAALRSDFSAVPQKTLATLEAETAARVSPGPERLSRVWTSRAPGVSWRERPATTWRFSATSVFPRTFLRPSRAPCAACAPRGCAAISTRRRPNENFDYLALVFYRKARVLYRGAIDREQSGKEPIGAAKWMGPGHGQELRVSKASFTCRGCWSSSTATGEIRDLPGEPSWTSRKRTIAKMFGLGKRSKAKPGPLLDKARDLYERLKAELNQDDDSDDE